MILADYGDMQDAYANTCHHAFSAIMVAADVMLSGGTAPCALVPVHGWRRARDGMMGLVQNDK
jgi:hypothetical protein